MDNKYLTEVHQLTRTWCHQLACCLASSQVYHPRPLGFFVTAHPSLLLFILTSNMRLLSELPLIEGCYRSTMIMYFFLPTTFFVLPPCQDFHKVILEQQPFLLCHLHQEVVLLTLFFLSWMMPIGVSQLYTSMSMSEYSDMCDVDSTVYVIFG